jgi:ArsR family transcriptional regulator, arsenate/arsenite/antimonite-responsive transcriptional repressor
MIEPARCPPVLVDRSTSRSPSGSRRPSGVLAEPARLRLINLIAARCELGSCVCDLTQVLGLSRPTVSHHLKVLMEASLLERDQRGKWAYFRLRPEPLELLSEALRVPVSAGPPSRVPSTSARS